MRSRLKINPLAMIKDAKNRGVLYKLDIECITNAIEEYPYFNIKNQYLFLNIFPSTIIHEQFELFIESLLIKFPKIKGSVVFEINEIRAEEEIWGKAIFLKRLAFLKIHGFFIAFDDLPLCRSSLKKMELLSPDFVKLDHTKSKGLSLQEISKIWSRSF